jgi:hypothetical protein
VLEARLASAAQLLRRLQDEVDDIEASDDRAAKRRIIGELVGRIQVRDPRARDPDLDVTYLFAPEGATRPRPSASELEPSILPLCSGYS